MGAKVLQEEKSNGQEQCGWGSYIFGANIFIELKCNVTQVITCLSSMNRQKRHSNILTSKVGLLFREGLKQGKNHMEG